MISRCVEVTSVAKVNKKLLVTRFCIAMRAPGLELLPPKVGSIERLESPASFWTPLLTCLTAPWARRELAPKFAGVGRTKQTVQCDVRTRVILIPLEPLG